MMVDFERWFDSELHRKDINRLTDIMAESFIQ